MIVLVPAESKATTTTQPVLRIFTETKKQKQTVQHNTCCHFATALASLAATITTQFD